MPEISQRTALYRLYDSEDRLLYVGVTGDPKRRFGSHRASKDWWVDVDHNYIEWFDSQWAALTAERRAIATESPKHNITGTEDYKAQQSATARAVSPERRRARGVGVAARAIQVRTFRTLRTEGVPKEEAERIALLARQRHKELSGLFGSEN